MIEFGLTLRTARENKGLSIPQLAQSTHLMARQIEALENEDFSKIAAEIYGRGFVRLYCEAVGLDPKPMINEFMEIYNGNRQPAIRMRSATEPVSAPVKPPAPPPAPEPPPVAAMPPPFDDIPPLPPPESPHPTPPPTPVTPLPVHSEPPAAGDFFLESEVVPPRPAQTPVAEPTPSPVKRPAHGLLFPEDEINPSDEQTARKQPRFSAPMPIDDDDGTFRFRMPQIPRTVWRILFLSLAALLLLWLAYLCLSSLVRALSNGSSEPVASEESVTSPVAPLEALPPPPAPPSEKAIAPLYID